MKTFLPILIFGGFIASTNPSKIIRYDRDDLTEGSECPLSNGSNGICRRSTDCVEGLEFHKKSEQGIPVCGFAGMESIICCPEVDKSTEDGNRFSNDPSYVNLNYEYCRDNFLNHRFILPDYYVAVVNGQEVEAGEFTNMVRIV